MATQKDVADFIGVSDRTIRSWATTPGFPSGKGAGGLDIQTVVRWRLAYLEKQNQSGKCPPFEEDEASALKLELMDKKARLHERMLNMEIKQDKLKLARQYYAPVEVITDILRSLSSSLGSRLDSLLPNIKRAWPDIAPEAVEVIKKQIALASQELANSEPDFSNYETSDNQSSSLWAEIFGEAHSADSG